MKIRVKEMRYVMALCLLIAVLMPAWAETYNQGQLALLAKECYDVGLMCGGMESGKIFAEHSAEGRATYNSMVPLANELIKQHNDLMLYIFAGNATILSKLLIEPYSYL